MTDPKTKGRVETYLGDCREYMKRGTGTDANFMLVDPPTAVLSDPKQRPLLEYILDHGPENRAVIGFLGEMGTLYAKYGKPQLSLVWEPTDAQYGFGDVGPLYRSSYEIGVWSNYFYSELTRERSQEEWTQKNVVLPGGRNPDRAKEKDVWRYPICTQGYNAKKKKHPNEKPLEMFVHLLEMVTCCGQTIFDPFMGSGSVGAACLDLFRRYIGIEIEGRWYKAAHKYLAEYARVGRVFEGEE